MMGALPIAQPVLVGAIMPIVSVCPYCNRGRIRASEDALGTTAKCPACGSEFTVIPTEESVLNAAGSLSPSSASSVPSVYAEESPRRPAPPPTSEPPAAETPPEGMTAPAPAEAANEVDPADLPDPARLPGMIAAAVALAGAVCWAIPDFGRLVWLGVAVAAAAVGGWALLAADRRKLFGWIGLGAGGGSLLLCLLVPWALGEGWWPERGYNADEAVAVGMDGELTRAGQSVDATKAGWAKNGVRVSVVETRRGTVDVMTKPAGGKKGTPKAVPAFRVVVEVANDSSPWPVALSGWNGTAVLTTASGDKVPVKAFAADVVPPADGTVTPRPLNAGTAARQTLYFDPLPADAGGRGTLELPLSAVGGSGDPVRFSVPFPDTVWTATPTGGGK
jgi:hypothetical protein